MKVVLPILSLIILACNTTHTNVKLNLQDEIAGLAKKDTSAILLKEKYLSYNTKYPKDSINAKYLLELARYYQSETNSIDSARYYAKQAFGQFGTSKSAPEAMLMYATMQDELSEFVHWSNETHKIYPESKSGEYALLNLAIQMDNRQLYDEALKYYEAYLAVYPPMEIVKRMLNLVLKTWGKWTSL